MAASINIDSVISPQDVAPTPLKTLTEQEVWDNFVQDGEVFIQDRLEVVAGPFGKADMDVAKNTYKELAEATPSNIPLYRITNPATNYRLIIIPGLFVMVGKQLDL